MIITSRIKNMIIVGVVFILIVALAIFGTYWANNNSWKAVVKLLTLPQCIVAYIALAGAIICYALHQIFKGGKA